MSKPRDYSSQSYSPSGKKPLKSVSIDTSEKSKEKNDLIGLNNKFVALIDKVKHLENEKQRLQTKLKILKEREDYNGKIEALVKRLENELEQQIDSLKNDREKLEDELRDIQHEVDDTKKRYEDKLRKRADLENDFVITKKEVNKSHMEAVDLAVDLEDLIRTLAFLRLGYDEEIKELESRIQKVVVHIDGKRSLDMDEFIKVVEHQYASMAARNRNEAEQWNQRKMESLVEKAGQREQQVRDIRREISDLLQLIQRRNGELDALKRREEALMKDIHDARKEGEDSLSKAQEDINLVQNALKQAREELASLVTQHQELLNIKLALDIEIATYRKLLEGEERRVKHLPHQSDVHLPLTRHVTAKTKAEEPTPVPDTATTTTPTITPDTTIIPPVFPATKKRLLIRLEVEEGKLVSESHQYTD